MDRRLLDEITNCPGLDYRVPDTSIVNTCLYEYDKYLYWLHAGHIELGGRG